MPRSKKFTVTRTLYLDPDTDQKLRKIAEDMKITVNDVIRIAILEYIKKTINISQ